MDKLDSFITKRSAVKRTNRKKTSYDCCCSTEAKSVHLILHNRVRSIQVKYFNLCCKFQLQKFKTWDSCTSISKSVILLKLNRDQLRWVVGLLTGHCHLKGHVFKLGFTDDPICERCLEEDESATHILCDCEAVAHIRFRHLGQFFMEPSDYYDAPIYTVLHFLQGVGLIKG
jgi:hypothetical protein